MTGISIVKQLGVEGDTNQQKKKKQKGNFSMFIIKISY